MRVLLVDDDELLTDIIRTHLVDQRYAVDIAATGEGCLEYLALFDYDLIVLDVILPDTNGKQLCQRLRLEKYTMPILMLTAQDTSEDKVEGLDSGADDYVVKPFIIEELMAHIRALLRRDFTTSTPILKWGELELDPRFYEVTHGSKKVELTPKEYAILETFLRNTEQIHTLDSIIDNAWSFEDPPTVDAVRTHIKGLRQKLRKQGAPKDFIATVYGFGYRLKPLATADEKEKEKEQKKPKKTQSQVNESELSDAIASIWEQNKDEVHNRLQRLSQFTEALKADRLSPDLHQKSQSTAHKLAGSLGCYGFKDGSRIAREIELILNEQQATLKTRTADIVTLVEQLEASIQVFPTPDPLTQNLPLVLTFSQNQSLIKKLDSVGNQHNLKFSFVQETPALISSLDTHLPDAIFLDLEEIDTTDTFFVELGDKLSTTPIIARLNSGTFAERRYLLEHGVHNVLPHSITVQQLLQEINLVIRTLGKQSKILIVDDDPHILSFLEQSLSPWGLTVSTIEDTKQFWPTLETIKPDLLILDIEMPQTDGLELCQLVRTHPDWQQLPILFLTTHEDESIRNHAFVVGADDFILKPVEMDILVNRIQSRLRRLPNSIH